MAHPRDPPGLLRLAATDVIPGNVVSRVLPIKWMRFVEINGALKTPLGRRDAFRSQERWMIFRAFPNNQIIEVPVPEDL